MRSLRQTHLRHAEHYKDVLANANALYDKGGEGITPGLALFDQEWDNIRMGWEWAKQWAIDPALEYFVAGPSLLSLRLPPQERIEWLERGLRVAHQRDDRRLEAEIWGQLGMANDALEKWKVSVSLYRECLKFARLLEDRGREGRTLGSLGLVYLMLGDKNEAKYSLEKALVIARDTGDRQAEGRQLGSLGLMSEGQERIGYFDQALEIARAVRDRYGEISHLGCLGMAWFDKGQTAKKLPGAARIHPNIMMRNMNRDGSLPKDLQDRLEEQDSSRCLQKAATYFEQAVAIAREISDYRAEGRHLGDLGNVLSEQGKIDQGIACYQQALAISLEMGDHQSEVRHLKHLRFAYLALGDKNEVHRIEKQLKEIAADSGEPRTENILEMFGSRDVDPFHEEYWRVSREEDNKKYWSEYYQIHLMS
ncbi:hypothetical protein TFLX_06094 [Thermoflexales bacterium]|nr:hypothetical protein TFLX_06094 [Thermoflexales bacterium]